MGEHNFAEELPATTRHQQLVNDHHGRPISFEYLSFVIQEWLSHVCTRASDDRWHLSDNSKNVTCQHAKPIPKYDRDRQEGDV